MKTLLTIGFLVCQILAVTLAWLATADGPTLAADAPAIESGSIAPPAAHDPAADAARRLIRRWLPRQADRFVVQIIPPEAGHDLFEIESRGDKIVLRGNNGVAVATGLNWFLKYHCHCHVSWYGNQLALPDPLPEVKPKVRRVAWAARRYFLNYCCFGYSLPWWDWTQWEQLVDWMALNGVNMPLSVTGQEAVWQAVCRRLGMSDAQIAEFLAGPPYLPFQWMGCLDGHGGPLPKRWIARHEELERKILARQRELGMTPVLQGFTGHVPAQVARHLPRASYQQVRWSEWQTYLLDPLDPLFAKIAGIFLEEQTRRFGTDHLYAADTFIEMVPPKGDARYLADLSRAIAAGMTQKDPQAVWVLQGWTFLWGKSFWTQPRIRAFLDAIPHDRMVVLDLACESQPMWECTEAFCGKPWLWCNVQNFGRTVQLNAALSRNNEGLFAARRDPKSGRLSGLGFVNEGLCYNPVAYDLMFEAAWRDAPVDLRSWIADYAHHRYGRVNADAQHAWQVLRETVLEGRDCSRGNALEQTPSLRPGPPPGIDRLVEAWGSLDRAADTLGDEDTFRFDLVNVARQVLANHATTLLGEAAAAREAKDAARFARASTRFLELLADLDELLATRREFLLGCWLEDAKRWGDTEAERARCQWNARRVLTFWGEKEGINDYARKQWSGMLRGYYAVRWQRYLDAAARSLASGQPLDEAKFNRDLLQWTLQWSDGRESYPSEPRGDSTAVARRLWHKYGDAIGAGPGKGAR
jgi:alpha-N-acetylglucosaminidase